MLNHQSAEELQEDLGYMFIDAKAKAAHALDLVSESATILEIDDWDDEDKKRIEGFVQLTEEVFVKFLKNFEIAGVLAGRVYYDPEYDSALGQIHKILILRSESVMNMHLSLINFRIAQALCNQHLTSAENAHKGDST
jgi:hypothetical protein